MRALPLPRLPEKSETVSYPFAVVDLRDILPFAGMDLMHGYTRNCRPQHGVDNCNSCLQQDIKKIANQKDAAAHHPDKNGNESRFEYLAQNHYLRQ